MKRLLFIVVLAASFGLTVNRSSEAESEPTPIFEPLPAEAAIIPYLQQPQIAVTNTNAEGPGSLSAAVTEADRQGGGVTIVFRLEQTDPGFNVQTGVWTIAPKSALVFSKADILLDGLSQTAFGGNTNTKGPEVFIDAGKLVNVGNFRSLVDVRGAARNWIRGLGFVDVADGSQLSKNLFNYDTNNFAVNPSDCRFSENFVGVSPDGESLMGTQPFNAITTLTQRSVFENNVISAEIQFLDDFNVIRNNYCGTNAMGTKHLPVFAESTNLGYADTAINLVADAIGNVIENNVIAGNRSGGVGRVLPSFASVGGYSNIIRNNRVGVGPNGENIAPDPNDPAHSRAVGIFVSFGDVCTGNIVGNFGGSGIQIRQATAKGPGAPLPDDIPPPQVTGNRVFNTPVGIHAAQIRGAVISGNTIENCSRAGVVVARFPVDASSAPGSNLDPNSNPFNLPTVDVTISGNTFTNVSGPGIGLAESALDVYAGNYAPNTRAVADPAGPNAYQPSPIIAKAERQTDGRIIVTGTTSAAGRLEVYASSRAARPGAPDTDVNAYGLGAFVMADQVAGGGFAVTIPAASAGGLTDITATVTVGNQTSEFARTVAVTTGPPPTDTEKPTVAVTAPASGLVVESRAGASVAVAWTSSDNVGVVAQSVRFVGRRGGQPFAETVAASLPGTASSFTLTVRPDDAVTDAQVVVEARDAAANVGEGRSGVFTITAPAPADTQKPTVSNVVLDKKKVARKKDSTLIISWQSADNVGVTAHDVSFAPDGTTFSVVVAAGLPGDMKAFTWTVPDKAILPKTKTGVVRVTARDAAGNIGTATSAPVIIK